MLLGENGGGGPNGCTTPPTSRLANTQPSRNGVYQEVAICALRKLLVPRKGPPATSIAVTIAEPRAVRNGLSLVSRSKPSERRCVADLGTTMLCEESSVADWSGAVFSGGGVRWNAWRSKRLSCARLSRARGASLSPST